LGDGTKTRSLTPKKIIQGVRKLFPAAEHSLMIKEDGKSLSCGRNDVIHFFNLKKFYQLGVATNVDQTTPADVLAAENNVQDFAVGYETTFMIKDGVLYGVGNNIVPLSI
jgi:alpha-tubulin suppressor-like RCC1 family protein